MKMGHFVFLALIFVVGYWIGQMYPGIAGGYPQKLFG